jgi:hypothetical protein
LACPDLKFRWQALRERFTIPARREVMNGWQRLGVVASVVWIFGAGYSTLVVANNRTMAYHHVLVKECMALSNDWGEHYESCLKNAADYAMKMLPYERLEVASVALVPVILGWPLAYLFLFLARWVKRGFVQQPSRSS